MHGEHDQHGQVVHVIRKGPRQEIRISLSMFKGRAFGDLRLFVPDKRGEWIPTRKGCTVQIDQLGELELAVGKLRQATEGLANSAK